MTPARAAERKAAAKLAQARSDEPFFPQVHVKLTGEDGNAWSIIGRVRQALRKAGLQAEAEKFADDAMSGDYDHVLQTCFKYVTVK